MDGDQEFNRLDLFQLPDKFRGRSAVVVQLWWMVQATLFAWSPQFMYGWRNFWLRLFGAQIGEGVLIRPTVKIVYPWKLKIGDYSWIGDDVSLYTLGEIEIGANTVVSQKCYICTGSHDFTSPTFDIFAKKITIGNGVWLASDVFVAPGITIGNGVVVGVRSTVLHGLPEGMVYYGNPAKPIKPRVMKEN
jgi:putative colanic acid biosynthesis acetyltransferase WcaF